MSGAHESTPLLPEAKIVTYNGTSRLRHDCAEVRNMYDNQGGKVCFFCAFGTGPSIAQALLLWQFFTCGSSKVAQGVKKVLTEIIKEAHGFSDERAAAAFEKAQIHV